MNRKRVLPVLGLLASLVLVWSATAGVLWNADAPEAIADDRFATAERLVFFRVDADKTLQMQLPAGAEALRLSTHLMLPPGTAYAPERQYLYGVRLRVVDPDGKTLLERPLFTRTRQSKAEQVKGVWTKESAFTTRADVQLTDEREFTLEFPSEVRATHGTLEIHYPGPQGAVLLRAYAQIDRAAPLFQQREATRVQRAEERAGKATFVPWEKLSYAAQQKLVDERWQRLDALGEPGEDFLTEAVYHSDFRLPLIEVARAEEEALGARRGVAVNVNGPARVVAWLWRARPDENPNEPAHVAIGTVSALGETPLQLDVGVPPFEPIRKELEIPAGAHTVTLTNATDLDLRYTLEGPRQSWIAPDALLGEASTAQAALIPDVRKVDSWVTGGACDGVELEVGDALDDTARLVRIDARAIGFETAPKQSTVRVTFLDEHGRQVGEAGFETTTDAAPFDAADLPLSQSGRVPCADDDAVVPQKTVEITDVLATVSAPSTARVFVPKTARRMVVHASMPTAVNLFGFVLRDHPSTIEPPYSEFLPQGMRWRNAPVEGESWRPLRPINHRALALKGAQIALTGQVRLEPIVPTEVPPPSGDVVSLTPVGAPASRELLEVDATLDEQPSDADRARALYARLEPNESRLLQFDSRAPTRPEVRIELTDASALGQVVQLIVDGEPMRRFRLRTTRLRELLPPLRPGTHDVLLKSPSSELIALFNRAPAGKTPPLELRTAWRVGDGLTVRVPKTGTHAISLNVVVYTESPAASDLPELNVSIDRGQPRHMFGVLVPRLTRAERSLSLPPSAKEAAIPIGEAHARWYPHSVVVRLGEDLSPGVHEIHLAPSRQRSMWARFFIYGQGETPAEPRQWNRLGWDEEDAP